MYFKKQILTGTMIVLFLMSIPACSSAPPATPTPTETALATSTEVPATPTSEPATATPMPTFDLPTLPPVDSTAAAGTAPAETAPAGTAPAGTPAAFPSVTPLAAGKSPVPNTTGDSYQYITQNLADKSKVHPGQEVTIIWKVKNTGKVGWTTDYTLRFFSGVPAASGSYKFPYTVAPGKTVELPVTFTAPQTAGTYNTWWKLTNPQSQNFGDVDFTFIVQ